MSAFRVGQFVKSAENALGIGKVADVDDEWVTVEYFDSPTSDERPSRTLPAAVVEPAELHQETRVYFQHPATRDWFVGRALIKSGDEYRVQFPNRKVGELPESALYVRWERPIEDPTGHLAQRVNETPYFHAGRAPFRASLVDQRAACAGMTGLFSSVIELEEHQIEVVRRVLEDPIQRYLLADEVGLGKTIEAGAIMRQYALDRRRDFQILVAVPRHLCEQWEEELATRFLFDQELGERVHVVPHDATDEIMAAGMEAGMVVIDEAHQIARFAHDEAPEKRGIYEALQAVTQVTDKLLLLSATPVLHNEAGYLAMLHLLDPALYDLDDVEGFRKTIAERQKVADLFYQLADDTDDDKLATSLDELVQFFPEDAHLEELVDELRDQLGGDADERTAKIESIRTHISETYRLHRRILRTRHSEQTSWLLPGRTALDSVEYDSPHRDKLESLLEEWRQNAIDEVDDVDSDKGAEALQWYRRLLEACCGLPMSLDMVLDERLQTLNDEDGQELFDGESKVLKTLADVVDEAAQASHRLEALVSWLSSSEADQKTVIFAGERDVADHVYRRLDEELESTVVRHEVVRHHVDARWKTFLSDPACGVLVCDRRAEEGLNLQGSQARIVHLELPLSPNRIEQRIGRLDRYGTGQPVESHVFVAPESEVMNRLVTLYDAGFGVFERSISPLAYLVEEKLSQLWQDVFEKGLGAVETLSEDLGGEDGEVARELERVRAQDELDALEASQKSDDEFYDRLWDVDFDADRLEEVAHDWIRNRLQFHRVDTDYDHERIMRYEYRTERTAKHPTLLPIRELLGRFAVAVDPRVNGFFSYPLSFHRGTACSHDGVRVARVGEPFITAMMDYIRWDDRGTSFAMWRHTPRARLERDPDLYFCFDFIVEADVESAVEQLEGYEHVTEEAVRLRADGLFPPLMKTVWVDAEGKGVDEETEAFELLSLPYDSDGVKRFGRDYNLNPERWEQIAELFEADEWEGLCRRVRRKAEDALAEEIDLEERSQRYAQQAVRRAQETIDRLRTRVGGGGADVSQSREVEQLELEEALVSALEEGIREPRIRLDAIGAIVLSTVDPFEEEER